VVGGTSVRVSVSKSGRSFSVAPAESVLDAGLRAGLNLPHGCRGGNCGACRARLLRGTVHYPHGRPLGLSDAEVEDGLILLCQARPLDDLSLETFDVSMAEDARIKRLPCRIERTVAWSHDVLGLFLRLPAAEAFPFAPGQYLDVILPGGRRRSFSIACPPHDAPLLELHVRRVPGGEWTEPLFTEPERRRLLSIEGPLGSFVYRVGSVAPLLLVGGGTGLAPLKSILRHVIDNDSTREVTLYWGVRGERDLYAHLELEDLARRAPGFRYCAVLSEADAAWTGRRGWVHDAVLEDMRSLDGYDIYAAGPPAMIEAVRQTFPARGADERRLFFEAFDWSGV
jgi:CDP-4-dehydro-6-deoxyglucose reductase